MTNDLTVHVVVDDDIPRRHLIILLVSAGFAVRTHKTSSVFRNQLPMSGRACLLIDIGLAHVEAPRLLAQLRSLNVDIPTIFLSGSSNVAMAVEAMKAGAADFIRKPFDDAVLIAAINRIASGDVFVFSSPRELANVGSRTRQLTEREQQVLAAVIEGLQNKVIACNLGISSRTVEVHRAHMMAKMQARNLAELMRRVMTSGGTAPPLSDNSSNLNMKLRTTLG